MRSLSASIVLLAGCVCLSAAALSGNGDLAGVAFFAGGLFSIMGAVGWLAALRGPRGPRP